MTFLSNPLNRMIVIAAIFVLILAFAFFSVVQPTLQQYKQSQDRLSQDITTYNDLKRVADQKPVYIALTKQIQSRLAHVELSADPRVYIPSYLKQIENLAKQDGLQVTAVTPMAVPAPSPGASAAPAPASGPQAAANAIPGVNAAARAAGAANTQAGVTNGVAEATGATPIPGPGRPAPLGGANAAGKAGAPAPPSARANALAYLNQSFTAVPINMELAGTYAQLEKFLRDLNTFPKLIGVGNVTLTPGAHQTVGETPTLTIILPITAYRLSPSGGAAAPAPLATPPGATRNGG
jgi:Tfp pilus assembly protein PilO